MESCFLMVALRAGLALCSDNVVSKCFPNEKLCVFARDKYGLPLYCDNTEHLNVCNMELLEKMCPSMYRCKEFYCIPISMVGTWLMCLNSDRKVCMLSI